MRCDIVIPVWNNEGLTKRCIDSIFSNTLYPYRLILIDNASQEPTKKYLEELNARYSNKVKLIVNNENIGNTAAGTQGMKYSDADYVCILDNDTVVCKGWLSEMVKVAALSKDIGIVNPSSNSFGLKKKKNQSLEEFASELNRQNSSEYVELGQAVGFCYLVKRDLINEIGYWDEQFSPGYFEDTDYSMRAKRKGYKSVMALGAYVYHDEHASFKSKDKKKAFEKLFDKSRNKFHALYGKPNRILYVISNNRDMYSGLLRDRTYSQADKGDFVSVFVKDSVSDLDLIRHGNIKKIIFGGWFFDMRVFLSVITKKKKFNIIYTDSERLFREFVFFKKLKFHKAEVRFLKEILHTVEQV